MPSQYRRRILGCSGIVLTVLAALVGAMYGWYRYTFPYGWSHCCLKGLGLSLLDYAQAHDGHFPAGGGCPEASLSLLYQWDHDREGHILCGKTKSPEVANEILRRGDLLGPDTCDWHYVEGLTLCDDHTACPRLGQGWPGPQRREVAKRRSFGVAELYSEEVIPESKWPQFLEEQERLMAARTEAAKRGAILPSWRKFACPVVKSWIIMMPPMCLIPIPAATVTAFALPPRMVRK